MRYLVILIVCITGCQTTKPQIIIDLTEAHITAKQVSGIKIDVGFDWCTLRIKR